MRKYWQVFVMGWENILTYRLNFVLSHIRNIIAIGIVYVLWQSVYVNQNAIAGYNKPQLLTYVIGSYVLLSIVFVFVSENIAYDITHGELSRFLMQPVQYMVYWFVRKLPQRLSFLGITVVEVLLLVHIFDIPLALPTNSLTWLMALMSVCLSLLLFTLMDNIVGIMTFWTLYPYGPRFMYRVLLQFFSGWLFPLEILPIWLLSLFKALPFGYLIYFPIKVFLGDYSSSFLITGLGTQLVWILIMAILLRYMWETGVKKYEGFE